MRTALLTGCSRSTSTTYAAPLAPAPSRAGAFCLERLRMRKLRPRFRLQNGTRFPVGASNGKRVPESGLRTGHAFRRRPQAETVFRIRRSEWDAFSGSALKRKLRPGIAAQNGMHFPPEPLTETASRNSAPEWDTFSGTALKRKLRPVLRPDSGTRFPLARHPESASRFERPSWDTLSVGVAVGKMLPR